jgi:hypothetical protein
MTRWRQLSTSFLICFALGQLGCLADDQDDDDTAQEEDL